MPYNISKGAVHRSLRYLDDMKENRKTLTWPTHDAKVLSYKIREALYACMKHPEFQAYHHLKAAYRIRNRGGWVEAEYVGMPESTTGVQAPEGYNQPDITDVQSVVGACINLERLADEILFPNAVMDEGDKFALFTWGGGQGWKLIDHGEAGVTMTKKDVEDIFLWKPDGHTETP